MHYVVKEKKSLPKSQYLLVLEIPVEEVKSEEAHVLAELKKDTELPGFRKGFVPEDILRKRMGELALFEEAASHALSHALAEIFAAEKLDVIARPLVEARKLAPGNPVEFKITLSLYPILELPDYKKLAAEENARTPEKTEVSEHDIDTIVAEIKKQHETATGTQDFAITDESVKAFGSFVNIADFRAKVKEGMIAHREERNREKRRTELLDTLTSKTKGDIPDVLVENELARMEHEMKAHVERMGEHFEEYLKQIKKDRETLRKEWRKDAESRARLQLMVVAIARAEKITVPEEELAAEVKHLLEYYKNADKENTRNYVETLLMNQKALAFLENQK